MTEKEIHNKNSLLSKNWYIRIDEENKKMVYDWRYCKFGYIDSFEIGEFIDCLGQKIKKGEDLLLDSVYITTKKFLKEILRIKNENGENYDYLIKVFKKYNLL